MAREWSDKSEWITNCPICYCAVTYQLRDYHIQYHEQNDQKWEKCGGREGIVST